MGNKKSHLRANNAFELGEALSVAFAASIPFEVIISRQRGRNSRRKNLSLTKVPRHLGLTNYIEACRQPRGITDGMSSVIAAGVEKGATVTCATKGAPFFFLFFSFFFLLFLLTSPFYPAHQLCVYSTIEHWLRDRKRAIMSAKGIARQLLASNGRTCLERMRNFLHRNLKKF